MMVHELQAVFGERAQERNYKGIDTTLKLAVALAGKVGKLCGSAKFEDRADPEWQVDQEKAFLADVFGYCLLWANHRSFDLESISVEKFNTDSEKFGSSITI